MAEYITAECDHNMVGIQRHPTTDCKCTKCGIVMTHSEWLIWKGGKQK